MYLQIMLVLQCLLLIGGVNNQIDEAEIATTPFISAKDEQAITASFCDLVHDPQLYEGKLVRIKASRLTWLDGAFLYDLACDCKESRISPIFDCATDEACSSIQKALDEKSEYNAELQGRVEAVMTGRFIVLPNKPQNDFRLKLKIQHIDEASCIPPATPWPNLLNSSTAPHP